MKFRQVSYVVLTLLFISIPLKALELDPFNTYQWNKENRFSDNIDTGDWYEWWYYKVIDPKTGDQFFFCYGVVNPWDTNNTTGNARAFVKFGDFKRKLILGHDFPVTEFESRYDQPFTKIGPHLATDRLLAAYFEDKGHRVSWTLSIDKQQGWNAMGWGHKFPNLFNIYWHPAQMDAKYYGTISVDDKTYIITDADGYQDRNWGRQFPEWWFWMAVNSFIENPDSSFVAGGGGAKTQGGISLPTAILLGLHHEGEFYEFRSSEPMYYFDWDMTLGHWKIKATNPFYQIIVEANEDPEEMMDLMFTGPTGKVFHDYETLSGAIRIQLYKMNILGLNWEKIAELSTYDKAGLEYGLDRPHENTLHIIGEQ